MSIIYIKPYTAPLPSQCFLMGLDIGTKTIGVALSDDKGIIATADQTIKRTKVSQDCIQLQKRIAEKNIKGIIVGLPLNLDGSKGPQYQRVLSFVHHMRSNQNINLPIAFFDERMSTNAAKGALFSSNFKAKQHKKHLDASAAAFILQNALDCLCK